MWKAKEQLMEQKKYNISITNEKGEDLTKLYKAIKVIYKTKTNEIIKVDIIEKEENEKKISNIDNINE